MTAILRTIGILLISMPAFAQVGQTLCDLPNPPFSLAPAEVQLSIQDAGFATSTDSAGGYFTVVNHTSKPITRILILAEFIDQKGQYLMTIPFLAGTTEELGKNKLPFVMHTGRGMKTPLFPDQDIAIPGEIHETTGRCPASVQVSVVDISFSDGSKFHYAASLWQVEPSVTEVQALKLDKFPEPLPFQDTVDAKIDADGRVSKVSGAGGNPQVAKWFETQLSLWTFSPKIKNGKKVPSELKLLFRIHNVFNLRDPAQFDEQSFQTGSVIAIDIFPKGKSAQNNQFIFAGGLPLLVPD